MRTCHRGETWFGIFVAAILLAAGLTGHAATQYWDIGGAVGLQGGNGNWSTNAADTNWNDSAGTAGANAPWTNGNDAVFNLTGASTATVNGVTVNTMTFAGQGPWVLAPGTGPLTLNSGLTGVYGANLLAPIVFAGDQTWAIGGSRIVSNAVPISETGGARRLTLTLGGNGGTGNTQLGTLASTNSNAFSGD
jgi:hypothetical protein